MIRRAKKILPSILLANEVTLYGEAWKKDTAYRKSLLYEAFQLILLSLTIIGLHYGTGEGPNNFFYFSIYIILLDNRGNCFNINSSYYILIRNILWRLKINTVNEILDQSFA